MLDPEIAKSLYRSFIVFAFGILGKMTWDYFNSGRVEKAAVYVTKTNCLAVRSKCPIEPLREEQRNTQSHLEAFKAETTAKLSGAEKRMDESLSDSRTMREDIIEIKEAQAHSNALLEIIVDKVK